jgi:hypothetical protein
MIKKKISKLEQKQEKQEKDKNEITALKDKDLLDTSFRLWQLHTYDFAEKILSLYPYFPHHPARLFL